jgi:capsular polysaccharide biosynthesis protein
MELKSYLMIIGKRIWLFLSIILLITVGSYLFTIAQPSTFDGSAFLNIVAKKQVNTKPDYYTYDNYYAIQANSLFADTVVAWLGDPTNVNEIYSQASIERPDVSLKNISKLIVAKKKVPASVQVTFNSTNEKDVTNLVKATIKFVEEKTASWSSEGLVDNLYVDSSSPIAIKHEPPILTNVLSGFLGGLIIALAIVFFQEYWQKSR